MIHTKSFFSTVTKPPSEENSMWIAKIVWSSRRRQRGTGQTQRGAAIQEDKCPRSTMGRCQNCWRLFLSASSTATQSLILAKCWQNRRYTLEFSNILAQLWGLILLLKSLPIFYHFWLTITWVFKLFLVCFRNQVVEVGQKIRQIAVRSALLNVNKLWRVFPLFVEFWDLLNSCLKLVGTPGMLRFIW